MENEDLFLRRAPYSLEGEQAVLGSMLIDRECVRDVISKLGPDDFYLKQNREIFETFRWMFSNGKTTDVVTVAEEMKKAGTYDEQVTPSYLAQLMEITPTSANVMEYAKIVADQSLKRSLATAAAEIADSVRDGFGDAESALEEAERKIYAIRKGRDAESLTPLKQVLPDVLDRLGEMAESDSHLPGLSTGFSAIDRKLMGLNKSDLILLAARPGMGKTALALNIAMNVARDGERNVAVFSLEMSQEQLAMRILSAEAFVENVKLKTGALSESDWEKIAASVVTLSQMGVLLDDNPSINVAGISAKCRRVENLGLVVIDYLQLMSVGGRSRGFENRQQIVSEISRTLKIMAKELDVPVLCLSQLSRANEKRDDKRPQLSDLRDSGAIEQDADEVLFLYREGYYDENADPNLTECIVAKNRHGETGTVELRWTPEYTLFASPESRREP